MLNENYWVILIVAGYLLLAAAGGLLLLSPPLRHRVMGHLRRYRDGVGRIGNNVAGGAVQLSGSAGNTASSAMQRWLAAGQNNRWLLLAALCLLLTPLLLVAVLSGHIDTGTYDDTNAPQNAVIAQLLEGEQLVPPPALPPEAFEVREVELVRPMLVSASRDWQLLDEAFRQRLLVTFRLMEERYGYKMALLEGYRSPGRQNMLAGMGSSVTNAAAFQSYHQYGLAADCAFLRDGKLVISERDPWAMRGYQLYGELAESTGLVWGGRWKMMDLGHVELRRAGVLGKPVAGS